ncbi:MAG: peptidoglycan-binding protein [Oscillospiraceae bacterium]|nr:peptidoglycan-binding protein [Oscillospiraceae bacterium]
MAIKVYKKGDEQKVATNFRAREFDCQGKGCCNTTLVDERLVEYLQKIRDHFGKPVYLTAYRCKTHNARTPNAAPNSYHVYGRAADFHINGVAPAEIAKYAESIGVKGIGLYDSFVHIDTRESKSFWYGHGQQLRTTFGGAPKVEETKKEAYSLGKFVLDVQKACGVAQLDGKAGPVTLSRTVTLSARKNRTHAAVKAVQKRLFALGYTEVGEADGTAGAKFTSAVAHFQQDNGCKVDGEVTAGNKTWMKLLGMI